jgi:transmembrane sensor
VRVSQTEGASENPITPAVTPDIAAEAAVWIARLHGSDRSSAVERECLAWQATSVAHRLAFERCTDTWQDGARVTLRDYATATLGGTAAQRRLWPTRRHQWSAGVALAAATIGTLAVLQPWRDIDTYATGVGEQLTVLMKDGTRMSLNTSTRVRVEQAAARRTVSVEEGEALFEVAKDAHRPFIVLAGESEVVAVGTVFSVRLAPRSWVDGDKLSVILIEGQVSVSTTNVQKGDVSIAQPVLLKPGDRWRLSEPGDMRTKGTQRARPQLDRPPIDQVIAWRRNEAVFDDASLSEAVAEMNRYSRKPVALEGNESVKGLRISGLFRTGDNAAFARAVAALHGLVVYEREDRLELAPR